MKNEKGVFYRSWLSLLPLALFLITYLGGSIAIGDFYKIPITIAFLVASAVALAVSKGNFNKRIKIFSAGASDKNIMLMVWIYILAGIFASAAKATGAVDATVNFTLSLLPPNMILLALFLAAAFVSLSIGTSVGTVVALTPIAAGVAVQTGQSAAELAAIVVGGSFFGDNLSFISDTTIAATQTQGCKMNDKFKMNIRIIWPAFVIMAIYCVVAGFNANAAPTIGDVDVVAIVPYATVILLSIIGVNVVIVLSSGILLTGIVGITTGSVPFWNFLSVMGSGVSGMGDLIVVALLAGGMLELIRANGGVRLIIDMFQRRVHSSRGAEFSIAGLVSVANICTANNTVAIITTGRIAKDLAVRYNVDPRRAASLLDTASCCIQGLLPYSVQMLLASTLVGCSPLEILPHLYYPLFIGICAIFSIVLRKH
ncbi:MAG: Na+/H+ antiporter NhaC family protein [Bacteroidales bacterium]|jgi:Na+/H+ antiporter NhaC|nr:Na+/H+ antiporter NhaC family protein [Bacteroidales bacterium]